MPLYRDGTVSLTEGSRSLTGVGTRFGDKASPGDILILASGSWVSHCYEIQSIESDTQATLDVEALDTVEDEPFVIIRSVSTANNLYLMRKIDEFLKDRQVSLVEFRDWMQGTTDGGPNGDGKYPLTDRYGVTTLIKSPNALHTELGRGIEEAFDVLDTLEGLEGAVIAAAASAANAADSEVAAAASANSAAASETGAATSETQAGASAQAAQNAKEDAETAADAAQDAKTLAEQAATSAAASDASAENFAEHAEQMAGAAEAQATIATQAAVDSLTLLGDTQTARDAALNSQAAAESSESGALSAAQSANDSASQAAASALDASTSAGSAAQSATEAQTAKEAAELARVGSETAQQAAEQSATQAGLSEAAAAQSAQDALDAAETTIGKVFDDEQTSDIKGWTSQKIVEEFTTRVGALAPVANSGSYSDLDDVPGEATPQNAGFFSGPDKTKLDGIEPGAQVNTVTSVAGKAGDVNLTQEDVGLSEVDNTSDQDKPVSIAQANALSEKVDKVTGKGLSTEDYTSEEKTKLEGIQAGAQVNTVTSVAGRTGEVNLIRDDVGLSEVDNTSDQDKPVSTAQASALDGKVDKVTGKGLSTEDFTTEERNKLAGIEEGAQANTVTSVAGKTGAVTLAIGDTSGNLPMARLSAGTLTGTLTVTGTVRAEGNVIAYYSDERLKTNIQPIQHALDTLLSLSGVRYTANELAETFGYDPQTPEIGLLAQQVQTKIPEAITLAPFDTDEETGESISGENYLTIQYEKLIPVLVEAVKDLSRELQALKTIVRGYQ